MGQRSAIQWLARLFGRISMVSLAMMMVLATVNVLLRSVLNNPILGTYEMVGLLASLTVFFSLANTEVQKGHITVTMVLTALPRRVRMIMEIVVSLFSAGVCFLIILEGVIYGSECWKAGEVTSTMEIPLFPFVYGLAAGFLLLFLVFLLNIDAVVKSLRNY